MIKSNGWNIVSVAELDGESAYWNADGDTGTVTPGSILEYGDSALSPGAPAGSSSSQTSSASGSSISAAVKPNSVPPGGTTVTKTGSAGGSSSSGSSSAPTGAAQKSGALSLLTFVNNVPAVVAAMAILLFSVVALA